MKEKVILFCLLIISIMSHAQEINTIIYDEIAEENILIGNCNKEGFASDDFKYWFQDEYDNYNIDIETTDQINPGLTPVIKIKLVMGTWCEDSHREVPRIIKILEFTEFDFNNLSIVGVNRNKKAEGSGVDQLNIELVPTIIFYLDEKEIGRIIESPKESLEKDMLKIISTN